MMPSAVGVHYDGDWSAINPTQVSQYIVEVDNVTQSRLCRATFEQLTSSFRRASFSLKVGPRTNAPFDASLVEESGFRDMLGQITQWERVFAEIPHSRDEFEQYVHGYQTTVAASGPPPTLTVGELALTVTSRIHYDYYYIPSGIFGDPSQVPKFIAYRFIQISPNVVYERGTDPGGATEIVAEDSVISRWRGNIYQSKTRYVPAVTFALHS